MLRMESQGMTTSNYSDMCNLFSIIIACYQPLPLPACMLHLVSMFFWHFHPYSLQHFSEGVLFLYHWFIYCDVSTCARFLCRILRTSLAYLYISRLYTIMSCTSIAYQVQQWFQLLARVSHSEKLTQSTTCK